MMRCVAAMALPPATLAPSVWAEPTGWVAHREDPAAENMTSTTQGMFVYMRNLRLTGGAVAIGRPARRRGNEMYSAKILGNHGSDITPNSAHKANFEANVKAKKSFATKKGLKK